MSADQDRTYTHLNMGHCYLTCLALVVSLLGPTLGWSDFHNSNCAENRAAIVHLFEWKWSDIANECERFLGPRGFCGVQVSPANEHAVITQDQRPWWERYQPVSYKLHSRSGNEEQFRNMVERCNKVGVRIYVDVILNHMAGMGRSGHGSGGSYFNSDEGDFPGVPYTMADFNDCSDCPQCCCINAWTDLVMVRNCRLSGLIDMNQKIEYVKEKQSEFLNNLIDIGVAGFRVDAAKHMWPKDIEGIWNRLNNLNIKYFPAGSKPFMYLEVIDQSQNNEVRAQSYTHLGRVTEFRYCTKIKEAIGNLGMVRGIWDEGWGMLKPEDAFIFVDNHDNQRGHGGGGDPLYFANPFNYKKAQAISLANTYGYPRLMSSYYFKSDKEGPPHNDDWSAKDVVINEDGSCGNGWVCEHRWNAIAGMASFAGAVAGTDMQNWWQSGNKIAFSRGNKGFFAMSNEGTMTATLQTGLPAGDYCNVVEGCPTKSGCQGNTIRVGNNGMAEIKITSSSEPFMAIHVGARSGSGDCNVDWKPPPTAPTNPPVSTMTPRPSTEPSSTPSPSIVPSTKPTVPTRPSPTVPTTARTTREPGQGDWRRTVIFLRAFTNPGNNLFFTGGIGHERRRGCSNDAESSPCAISIVSKSLGDGQHYDGYNSWRKGDTKLDWYGAQKGQGYFNGQAAMGTPAAWTTNDPSQQAFQPLNRWGPGYWMTDFEMNCDETEDGWFEVKGFVTGWGWETDIFQDAECSGSIGGSRVYQSENHMARCGHVNTFIWKDGSCIIDDV